MLFTIILRMTREMFPYYSLYRNTLGKCSDIIHITGNNLEKCSHIIHTTGNNVKMFPYYSQQWE